jgi:hypothetical protein
MATVNLRMVLIHFEEEIIMKKRFRLRFLGVCFLALLTIFTAFSTLALADPPYQGGGQPSTPMPPPPPPPPPPDFPWWIFLLII